MKRTELLCIAVSVAAMLGYAYACSRPLTVTRTGVVGYGGAIYDMHDGREYYCDSEDPSTGKFAGTYSLKVVYNIVPFGRVQWGRAVIDYSGQAQEVATGFVWRAMTPSELQLVVDAIHRHHPGVDLPTRLPNGLRSSRVLYFNIVRQYRHALLLISILSGGLYGLARVRARSARRKLAHAAHPGAVVCLDCDYAFWSGTVCPECGGSRTVVTPHTTP